MNKKNKISYNINNFCVFERCSILMKKKILIKTLKFYLKHPIFNFILYLISFNKYFIFQILKKNVLTYLVFYHKQVYNTILDQNNNF